MIETGGAILARLTGLYDGFCAVILGNWLLESLLASTILCAIVLLIRRPVARLFGPHIAYGLWLIPALRMVMPPLPADFLPALPRLFVAHHSNGDTLLSADYFLAALPSAQAGAWAGYIPTLIVTLWLGGALVHLGWQLWGHRRLMVRLADAETVGWQRDVRILRTRAISGPLSVGLLRRSVVLPHESRLALNAQERDLAIVHELTHHARGDLWANVVAVIFSALHWFNPLMRHAWRAFRFDQEAACDAHVLRRVGGASAPAYARALAKAASGRPSAFVAAMLGRDGLKDRLTMLVRPAPSPLRRFSGQFLGASALMLALGITATPSFVSLPQVARRPAPARVASIDVAPQAAVAAAPSRRAAVWHSRPATGRADSARPQMAAADAITLPWVVAKLDQSGLPALPAAPAAPPAPPAAPAAPEAPRMQVAQMAQAQLMSREQRAAARREARDAARRQQDDARRQRDDAAAVAEAAPVLSAIAYRDDAPSALARNAMLVQASCDMGQQSPVALTLREDAPTADPAHPAKSDVACPSDITPEAELRELMAARDELRNVSPASAGESRAIHRAIARIDARIHALRRPTD